MTQLYRHFDKTGKLLYVGISLSALHRLTHHNRSRWFRDIALVTFEPFKTKEQALFAESCAIIKERPLFNVRGKAKAAVIRGRSIPMIPYMSPRKWKRIRKYFAECGRNGGLSRSPAKVAAARKNAAKAAQARKKQTP